MIRRDMKNLILFFVISVAAPFVRGESLPDLVGATLESNPEVQARAQALGAVREELRQARAGFGPSVELAGGVGVEESDNATTRASGKGDETLSRRERSITLRQMLFDGFGTKETVDQQTARVQAATQSLQDVAERTALRAIEVYLEVVRQQELLRLARENLEAHEQTRDQIELRSRAGIGRRADLDQVVGRYALAMANVIAEEANLADARSNFLRVTGRFPGDLAEPAADLEALVPTTLDAAEHLALARHPALRSAEADVAAAEAQHRASRSPFYPRLDVEAGQSWNNNVDGQRGDSDDQTVMLRLRYNLFNSGKDDARRRQTAYQVEEAREVRNNTSRQVIESIRLSWNQFQAGTNKMQYLGQHVESSRLSLDAYQKQFDIGKRSLLDLLDSKNELFDANRAFVNTRFDRLFALYRIQAGLGTLLDSLGIDVAFPETR